MVKVADSKAANSKVAMVSSKVNSSRTSTVHLSSRLRSKVTHLSRSKPLSRLRSKVMHLSRSKRLNSKLHLHSNQLMHLSLSKHHSKHHSKRLHNSVRRLSLNSQRSSHSRTSHLIWMMVGMMISRSRSL